MTDYPVTRDTVLAALQAALEPLPQAHAMWEGGAASWGRFDAWSDLDLQVEVDDDHVEDTLETIERVLAALSPIELRYRLPEPTWHGHAQVFYRLRDASPFLMIDLVVMKHSSADKFLEPEIHGPAVFYWDKCGVSTPPLWDQEGWAAQLRERLATLRTNFDLYQIMTLKELHRGNALEALAYYLAFTLRPLLEVLNMRYRPTRYNFHTRYVYYELPRDVVQRLERLYFVADAQEIDVRRAEAETWFHETVDWLDQDGASASRPGS